MPSRVLAPLLLAAVFAGPVGLYAQGRGRGPAPAPAPRAAAPIDLTGYWVSIVTEDWRFRMLTPRKGDYNSVPLNEAARKVAGTWDPAKDEAAGEQCKSYGAPALMRVPGRLRITWQDDNTLRIDTDSGMQTRLFHFGDWKWPGGEPAWQGSSAAQWVMARTGRGGALAGQGDGGGATSPRGGSLKVVTTHLRPGYLRKNGVPYSAETVLTEYYDVTSPERNGDRWLMVTTVVDDPRYLTVPFVTSTHFKKQADGSGWEPEPCSAK